MDKTTKAKEQLEEIKKFETLIRCGQREKEKLRSIVFSNIAPMNSEPVQSSPNQDKLGSTMAKIIDLQNKIDSQIDKYTSLINSLFFMLEKLSNPNYIEVLYLRYFVGVKWHNIALQMNYSNSGLDKLHSNALAEFEKILDSEETKDKVG